ncbi:MAG: MFS transporter [Puniceicoccales bacterium]|jgi:MFS family permease|nr:MFS transporter [Puniceicoccales bacterium]
MLQFIRLFVSPILSYFIFMTGSSLLLTVLTLVFHDRHISVYWTAGLTCAYYAGYVISAIHVEKFIVRVGFIRAHTTFAALATLSTLLHVFWFNPFLWLLWRFTYGVGLAGLCLVTQNWFLHSDSTGHLRGRMLAIYMITMYASQSFGQYLLRFVEIHTLTSFCIVAFCTSLCVIPVSMTKTTAPACAHYTIFGLKKVFEISPSGTFGGLCSGVLLGCIYGMYPNALKSWQHSLNEISTFMTMVIIGGMLLQYPIGKLADYYERRCVLMALVVACLACTLLAFIAHQLGCRNIFLLLTLLWGGLTFTIYPVSLNLTCDLVQPNDLLSTTGGLMVAYSVGASVGPFLGAGFMHLLGPQGFYVLFMLILITLGCFVFYRTHQRVGLPVQHQKAFTWLPAGAALTISRIFARIKYKKHTGKAIIRASDEQKNT